MQNFNQPAPFNTHHPLVGFRATGRSLVIGTTLSTAVDVEGDIVSYNGTDAMLLLSDGRIVNTYNLKLADPAAALAALTKART